MNPLRRSSATVALAIPLLLSGCNIEANDVHTDPTPANLDEYIGRKVVVYLDSNEPEEGNMRAWWTRGENRSLSGAGLRYHNEIPVSAAGELKEIRGNLVIIGTPGTNDYIINVIPMDRIMVLEVVPAE